MKKQGKKLTKRLTAFLMSFVMVMSLVTIAEPMKVQAAIWGGGTSITDPRYVQGSGWIISNLKEWKYISFIGNFSFDASSSISLYIDGIKQTYTPSEREGSDGQFQRCNTDGKLFYSYYDSSSRTYYLDEIKNYTITYKTYSGSTTSETYYKYYKRDITPSATVYVKSNNSTYSLKTNTTETGYTYGWYTSESEGTNITSISSISGTTTLYEQRKPNTYYVKYDVNLPSGSSSSSTQMDNQQFTYDDFTNNLSANTYEVEGYSFLGWSTEQNATAPEFTDGEVLNKNLTSTNGATVNLYAVWEAIPSTITLKADDATYTGTKTIYEKYGTGYYLNESYTKVMTASENKILLPKKEGYDFAGYYTGQDGSGTQIINENGYITGNYTANTELYAHWVAKTANYTIQYHENGGTIKDGAVTTQSRTYTVAEDAFTLKSMSDMFVAPVLSTGGMCEFLGWSTSPSSSTVEYADNTFVSDLTNVNGATIHLYAVWRSTLPTSIQNGSFESPAIGSWYSIMSDSNSLIAWKTTASDHKIELARPSKNMSAANGAYHTATAADGYQFAELCANQVGALYQTVSTFSGNTLKWGFSHRGRSGDDTMELWIGKPDDVEAVLEYYTSHNNSVAGISGDLLEKYNTISDNGSRRYTDGNTQWNSYTGNYVVPDGQIETTFAFVSIAASGNKISYGNLLDNVYFTAEVPPKTQLFEYDATKGGAAVAQINGNPTSGKEAFVSVGSTFEIYPAADDGYTYNGGFVNGEYKSADELPLRYTVADADTSLKYITLLFSKDSTIIFDKECGSYEDDEYDLKASGNNQFYILKANPTKEGYAFDKWMIAGSDKTLTEGNYIAYETDADSKTYIRVYNDSSKTNKLYECESELGINLIATYRITTFPSAKVVLSPDGGNINGEDTVTYELDESDLNASATQGDVIEYNAIILPKPTKEGLEFQGWKIGDKVYGAGTEIKYAISSTNGNGTVTIGTDAQSAITSDTTYTLTAQWGEHTVVTDSAVLPTCTETGLTEGSHCSVCNEVIDAQSVVPALGHDWSGEWTIIKQPTDTEDGKKEKTCTREGCGVKKYEVIPKNGTTDDLPGNVSGTLEKDAEVASDSPVQQTTLDNKKSELLNAPNIFTDAEKQQIEGGTNAKVWLEVTKTDEGSIPTADKTKVENEAKNIMGDNPTITYFDVDLFKQIAGGTKEQLHEPGTDIKVTIQIPGNLLNHDRTMVREYKIIRLHDGEVSVLSGEFNEASGEFTFATDKFSTYAIAYNDTQLVTGITLTPDSATLTSKGATVQLTATVTPENATDKSVIWTSSNTDVATVDGNGKVTAIANGTCTITVTTIDGGKTATSTIKVNVSRDDDNGNVNPSNPDNNNKMETPKTGDDSNPILWFSLLLMSLAGLAGLYARKKQDKKSEIKNQRR